MIHQRLLLVLVGCLCSCHYTEMAISDPSVGFERLCNQHSISLHGQRTEVLEALEGPGKGDLVVVIEEDPSPVYYRFVARFKLRNNDSTEWKFAARNTRLVVENQGGGPCPTPTWWKSGPDVHVPSRDEVTLDVPVYIAVPPHMTLRSAEKLWLNLHFMTADKTEELSHRRFLVESYNQGWQTVRFFTAFLTTMFLMGL